VVVQPNVVPSVLDMGPGPSSNTIVRWTAPNGGAWHAVGNFFGTGITTADVHMLHNGVEVFNSPVNGSSVAAFSLEIPLKSGDTVDFAAGPGPGGDPTGFNVTITPEEWPPVWLGELNESGGNYATEIELCELLAPGFCRDSWQVWIGALIWMIH